MAEYDIFVQMAFDLKYVIYMFMAGLGSGVYFFSVFGNYWRDEFRPLAKTSSLLTPIFVAIGMLFLLIELGRPLRMWRLFINFRPKSAISWGVWLLGIFFVLSVVYAYLLRKGDGKAKIFAYAGLPFAFLVPTYSGIVLAQAPGKVLYHTALLPWLFLTGALICGLAVVILISVRKQDGELVTKLGKYVAWLVVLELAMLLSEVLVLFNGGAEEVRAVKALLVGQYSFLFWVLEIIIGAAIPATLYFIGKVPKVIQQGASVLLLMGIFTMRYIVVIGGQLV